MYLAWNKRLIPTRPELPVSFVSADKFNESGPVLICRGPVRLEREECTGIMTLCYSLARVAKLFCVILGEIAITPEIHLAE